MKILGIESSCDETAVSVVEDGVNVLSNIVATQIAETILPFSVSKNITNVKIWRLTKCINSRTR